MQSTGMRTASRAYTSTYLVIGFFDNNALFCSTTFSNVFLLFTSFFFADSSERQSETLPLLPALL